MGKVWTNVRRASCSAGSANDIIVVRQPDGTHRCSPVNVRFRHQKAVANWDEKIVTVSINGKPQKQNFSLNELKEKESGHASLCLQEVQLPREQNDITFAIRLNGEDVQVKARMFRWCWDSRIVLVDVDGTITKSDKRGILCQLMNMDWVHDGVCHLLSAIQKYGYKVIYLSGRPRNLAESTRSLLDGIEQDGEGLPKGAVIVSTNGWKAAICRELCCTQDKDFKIPMLQEICKLFASGEGATPFYAGIGNRRSDYRTHRKLKIEWKRVYQVNHSERRIEVKGEEGNHVAYFVGSFIGLSKFVGEFFPEVKDYAARQDSQTFARARNIFRNLRRRIASVIHSSESSEH